MEGFFNVKTTEEVLEILDGFGPVGQEQVELLEGLNRVLSEDLASPEDLPSFNRSSMDGYAVRARDTFGASESLPALLEVAGEIPMGQAPAMELAPGKAIRIATGGMLPKGADAVVMIEYCHPLDATTIEVTRSVSPFENVIAAGDDIRKGQVVLRRGHRLRPQDLGILAGLGISKISVYSRPRVAIISTGDEVVDIHTRPGPAQVRDINRYTLSAFCRRLGAEPVCLGLCKDDFQQMRSEVEKGLDLAHTVWISGGSSVGTRDLTLKVLESFRGFQLLVHGVSVSPGKPTIIGTIQEKPIVGLPGHVSSALVVAHIFMERLLLNLRGEKRSVPQKGRAVEARISRNVESAPGRDDYIRVKLIQGAEGLVAEPLFGKSGLISPLVEADGLVCIPRNLEGLYEGDKVTVTLFD